jgi:outer membrane receptor protein involved in Fe transport
VSSGIEGNDLDLDCRANNNSHTGTLGKFSTKYKLSADQSIYFTVAEGFRRGGANAVPVEVDHNRTYEPDTAVNYELGMHSYLLNQQLRLSGALFYIDWEDIQILTAIDGYYGGFVNAKGARSKGIELEANAQMSSDWSLRAGFSLTDAQLTEGVENISGGEENAYAGDTLPGSPRYQWNLGVDYAHAFDSLSLNGSFTFSRLSDIYTELNDEFVDYQRLAGYNMANARIGVSLRNWQIGAFVNNIANTRAVTGRRSASLHGEQGQFEYITRPRTIGLSFNYTY